jgi:NSS family neurotransmitter:Na+ symporter
LTDKIFLAIGGMLISLFAGWFLKKQDLKDELTNGGAVKFALFEAWYFMIKFVIPIAIGFVAYFGIKSIEQTGLMVFGLGIIGALALFSKKL